jgi:hypothetical protein
MTAAVVDAAEFLAAVLPVPDATETMEIRARNATSGEMFQAFELNVDAIVEKAMALRSTHDVWFGPYLRSGKRGAAANATHAGAHWGDVDFKCFDDSEDGARAALRAFPLEPSAIVRTGHGYQPWWLADEPIDRDDDHRALCVRRGINTAISTRAQRSLDGVHDIAHVMRIPDTLNLKQKPGIPIKVVRFNKLLRYSISDFIDKGIWDDRPDNEPASSDYETFDGDPEEALRRAIRNGLPNWVIGALEQPTAHVRGSLSELDFAVLRQLRRAGLTPAEAESVWVWSELGDAIHESGTAKTRARADYRRRTVERASAAEQPQQTSEAGASRAAGLRFRTAKEIGASAAVKMPWIVPGFAARGAVSEVDAPLKKGKTRFLLELCRAVVYGKSFVGRPTTRTNVIYLTEQGDTSFAAELAQANLLDEERLTVLSYHDTSGLAFSAVIDAARAEANRCDAAVLIVDTFGQFSGLLGESENNAGDALAAIAPLQAAASSDNLAVIIARHDRKSGGEVGVSGRGSSALSGVSDIIVQLRAPAERESTRRTLHTLSRFTETPPTLVIELTDHGYRALGNEAAVAFDAAVGELLGAIPNTEDSAKTFDSILAKCDGTAVRRSTAQSALKKLVEDRQVRRIGGGKKGDAYRYWRPANDV